LQTFLRTQVFGPEDAAATIQAAVNAAYALNGGQPDIGQFSPHRCGRLESSRESMKTSQFGGHFTLVAQSHRASCV